MSDATSDGGSEPLAAVRAWVEGFVIGLDLCPFAGAVARREAIAYVLAAEPEPEAIAGVVAGAMVDLVEADAQANATTLVVAPALTDFETYLDVLEVLEDLLEASGFAGVLQIASFHPEYRFADSDPDDVANASNQAPHPVYHLLREDDVTRAVDGHPDVDGIPDRNVDRLRTLGWAEVRRRRGW